MYNINGIKIELIDESVDRLVNIPDEEYFAGEDFKGYVSNSSMALINPDQGGSPTKFVTGFSAKKSTGALELGTAVHRMSLEKDKYYIDDLDKPTEKVCAVMDKYFGYIIAGNDPLEAIKDACIQSDYYAKNLTQVRIDNVLREGNDYLQQLYDKTKCADCIVLTREHKDRLEKCMNSIKANDAIVELLDREVDDDFIKFNEDVFIMKAEATLAPNDPNDFEDKVKDLWLKIKVDNWSIDFKNKIVYLNDLKTTGGSIADFGGTDMENMAVSGEIYKKHQQGSFEKFHYYRQMAFYMRVLKAYVGKKYNAIEENGWTFKANMLVVETNEPHYSHVFEVSQKWLDLGQYEYESLLKRIAYHNEYGYDSFINITLNGTTVL